MYAKDNYDEVTDAISGPKYVIVQYAIMNELLFINRLIKHNYYWRAKCNLLENMT